VDNGHGEFDSSVWILLCSFKGSEFLLWKSVKLLVDYFATSRLFQRVARAGLEWPSLGIVRLDI
jgi:hypothetical protein